jgi:multimeric flavodoxin WrbA
MNHVAIVGSPRKSSFSLRLHNEFLNQFKNGDFKIDIVNAYDANVGPCTACNYCEKDSKCIFNDKMTGIYQLIRDADIISVSSPLYFSTFPSPLKAIIDRCQLFWEEERRTGNPIKPKKGFLFCAAGSDYKGIFSCVIPGIKHFFNTINTAFDINETILIKNCDTSKEIAPEIIESCRILGMKYAGK